MVTTGYLLHRPSAPSRLARLLHQRVLPAAINGVGAIETGIAALRRGRSPVPPWLAAVAAAALTTAALRSADAPATRRAR